MDWEKEEDGKEKGEVDQEKEEDEKEMETDVKKNKENLLITWTKKIFKSF